MVDITVKSTGFLIDELITTRFKVEVNPTPETIQRMQVLDRAIKQRLNNREDSIYLQVVKLQVILRQCWEAQEIIMGYNDMEFKMHHHHNHRGLKKLGQAALTAQRTNAQRNKLIREIDDILGESDVSPLGKTYT